MNSVSEGHANVLRREALGAILIITFTMGSIPRVMGCFVDVVSGYYIHNEYVQFLILRVGIGKLF